MVKAWPRFLPDAPPEAIAHALIIEAYAIVVAELSEGHATLGDMHRRALAYTASVYTRDEIRDAMRACAADPGNQAHDLVIFWPLLNQAGDGTLCPAA